VCARLVAQQRAIVAKMATGVTSAVRIELRQQLGQLETRMKELTETAQQAQVGGFFVCLLVWIFLSLMMVFLF
jgi:hypothetical protein